MILSMYIASTTMHVQGTCILRSLEKVPRDRMHLVYAFEKISGSGAKQLSLLRQSIHTTLHHGCASDHECTERLIVHIFYEGFQIGEVERYITGSVLDGLDLILHPIHFDEYVSTKRKVWGYKNETSIVRKLTTAANYFRFYCASILHELYSANSFLYLDVDTVFLAPGLKMLFQRPLPLASFGIQERQTCTAGKMLLLHDKRLEHYGIKPRDPCLAAAVMLVNISRWMSENITEKLDDALLMNAQQKLWHLGSLPPLMVVLNRKWTSLQSIILDGKGSNCETIQESEHLIAHPFKDECAKFRRPQPRVCHSFNCPSQIEVGSHRIACQQSTALARILGVSLIGPAANQSGCDIMIRYDQSAVRVRDRAPIIVHFKPGTCEACRADPHEFKIADNDFIDQMLRKSTMKSIRLNLVEDVRTEFIRHTVYTGLFENARPATLCYHGNHMHVHSLLRNLGGIRAPYVLRMFVPRVQRDYLHELINESPVCGLPNRTGTDPTGHLHGLSSLHDGIPSKNTSKKKCELFEYNPSTIYEQLASCDVGLAPMAVSQRTSIQELANVTREFFETNDSQPEDLILRCKRTSNAGRVFSFMQIGVPTVADPCPDVMKFAVAHKDGHSQQLLAIAHRPEAWSKLINLLLISANSRLILSQNALEYSKKQLTTRYQAALLLNKLSCLKRVKHLTAENIH